METWYSMHLSFSGPVIHVVRFSKSKCGDPLLGRQGFQASCPQHSQRRMGNHGNLKLILEEKQNTEKIRKSQPLSDPGNCQEMAFMTVLIRVDYIDYIPQFS